jgi:tripartite-type tricarboxylate transporter receptor subunit TctC
MRLVAAALAAALTVVAALSSVLSLPSPAAAQDWPNKPIRFIVPFGPGSATDTRARIVANDLSPLLGQPVVIENRAGADGAIGGTAVARAAPDGYTFLFGSNSPLVVVPHMRKEPPYDPLKDFTPITFYGDNTFFFAAHPSVPAKTMAELVA